MKIISLLILILGIGLSASYGSRLTPEIFDQMVVEGRAKFLKQATKKAHSDYCEMREKAKLPAGDGCGEHRLSVPTLEEGTSAAAAARVWDHYIEELLLAETNLSDEITSARVAWLTAWAADAVPSYEASLLKPPSPTSRVGSWFNAAGGMFLLGLLLSIIGALLGRRIARAEALASPSDASEGGGPVDFGELLSRLVAEATSLSEVLEAKAGGQPEEFDALKDRVYEAQVSMFQPLIEARLRLQARYGMIVFAEIFGPLSSAERKMNRAWAALVDRHWGESKASVTGATLELRAAQQALVAAKPLE